MTARVAAPVDITDVASAPAEITDAVERVPTGAMEVPAVRDVRFIPVGAPVQFILDRGPCKGEVRAAVVVKQNADGSANLQVFTDGDGNKVGDALPPVLWVRNAGYNVGGNPGTYREIA